MRNMLLKTNCCLSKMCHKGQEDQGVVPDYKRDKITKCNM